MKKYLLLIGLLTVVVLVSEGSLSHSPPQKATVVNTVDIVTPDISTIDLGGAVLFNQDAEVTHFSFFVDDIAFNDPYLERSERWRRNRNLNLQGIFYSKAHKPSHLKTTVIKLC